MSSALSSQFQKEEQEDKQDFTCEDENREYLNFFNVRTKTVSMIRTDLGERIEDISASARRKIALAIAIARPT